MKKYFYLLGLLALSLTQCKKDEPAPTNTDSFIGYWENYDHFYHQPVLDTLFRDTNQFVMFDLEVINNSNLYKHSHAGGASITYKYSRTATELTLELTGADVTYEIVSLSADSMILQSIPGPSGGIPTPDEDKDVWYFVKR
jgi:hypothetical protein